MNRVFRGGAKFSSFSGVLVQNQAFQKGDGSHPLFQFFCSGGCWWMLLLDCKKGGGKKTIKQVFFCHPLLERRKGVKRRERPEVKNTTIFTLFFWALKTGSGSNVLGSKLSIL